MIDERYRISYSTRALRQCLPDIGLRNSKLPCDCGRLDACLKAARTAFSLRVVNEPTPSSAASWRRCGFASATRLLFRRAGRPSTATLGLGGDSRKRRLDFHIIQPLQCSGQSFGKKWRCCEARLSVPALPFGTAEGPAAATVGGAENKTGVVSAGRRVGMPAIMPPVAHRGNG